MDRSWISTLRISDAYEKGVEEFLQFTQHIVVSNQYKLDTHASELEGC